jgi:hypothetical protein
MGKRNYVEKEKHRCHIVHRYHLDWFGTEIQTPNKRGVFSLLAPLDKEE